jgi:beta-mannosidase
MKPITIDNWTISGPSLSQPLSVGSTFDIMSILVQNNCINHPYVEDWEVKVQWVGQQDWMAQGTFTCSPEEIGLNVHSLNPSIVGTKQNTGSAKPNGRGSIGSSSNEGKPDNLKIWIEFPQVDTISDLYINNAFIGSTTSAFYSSLIDATSYVIPGENIITINFRSPETKSLQEAEKRSKSYPFGIYPLQSPHRNMIRKPQCHGGWDWGPCIMTSGIYEPVRVFPPSEFLLTEGQVLVFPPDPSTSDSMVQKQDWVVQFSCRLQEFHPSQYERLVQYCQNPDEGSIEVTIFDKTGNPVSQSNQLLIDLIHFSGEMPSILLKLVVTDPDLWWPNGLGEQHLYSVKIQLPKGFCAQFPLEQLIGFRDLQLITEPDEYGTSFYFTVNGRAFYGKGANWIPADGLPTMAGPERITSLLTSARDANMNMIRVWGGGQYESLHFYEECSRLGLVVWQDFMFACGTYPGDSEFLSEVEQEVLYQVRRLSGFPSIGLWCGNNENLLGLQWYVPDLVERESYLVDYDRLYEGTIGRVVRSLDPTRRYWPSSPSAGKDTYGKDHDVPHQGDMHYWKVWHHGLPLEGYLDIIPRFCSEFGFQSFASPEGISRTIADVYEAGKNKTALSASNGYSESDPHKKAGLLQKQLNQPVETSSFLDFPAQQSLGKWAPDKDWHLSGTSLEYHQKNPRGNTIIMEHMLRTYGLPRSTEQLFYTSQVLQARAFETAVDYWRSKAPRSMGSLYWQLNDLWPVASWSSIEYPDKWKLTHYKAKDFFQPIRIALIQHPRNIPQGQYAPRVFDIEAVLLSDTPRQGAVRINLELLSFTGERRTLLNQDIQIDGKFSNSLGLFSSEDLSINPKDWCILGQLIQIDQLSLDHHSSLPLTAESVTKTLQSRSESSSIQEPLSQLEDQIILSESVRLFVPDKDARIHKPNLVIHWTYNQYSENPQATISVDVPTMNVFLDTPGILGRWSHNGILVLPNEPKTLEFLYRDRVNNPWSSGIQAPRDRSLVDWYNKGEFQEMCNKIQELTWIYHGLHTI